MAVQQIGKNGPIFGVPEELGKGLGIGSKFIQEANLRFSNNSYAVAEVKLIPEVGETLNHLLEHSQLMFCRKDSNA